MNAARSVRLVARREVVERARDRGFLLSTLFTLVLIGGLAALPALLGGGTTRWTVATVGDQAGRVAALVEAGAPEDVEVSVRALPDVASAERRVRDGEVTVALVPGEVLAHEELDPSLEALVLAAIRQDALRTELERVGAAEVLDRVGAVPLPEVRLLDPPDRRRDTRVAIVSTGMFVLFGQLFGYGFWVASGVVEEKSSRVVEILLGKVRPRHLLMGKVLGIGILGLGQLALVLAVGLGVLFSTGAADLSGVLWLDALMMLGWFVLGFALFAALFAVAGALATRSEDLQNTSSPVTIVVFAALAGAFVALGNPGGRPAQVLGLVPLTSPIVQPIRVAAGESPLWEPFAAAALVALAVWVAFRFAGRVYTGAALRTDGTTKLRAALRGP